jgi:dihydroorotate dehydrogenase electron transfer subunit
MSVAGVNADTGEIEIIFKIVGRGTALLSRLRKGDPVNILGPLGVSFERPRKGERVIIVAGGIGFPPLLFLATHLIAKGHDPRKIDFFYGGRCGADVVECSRIRRLGVNFHPTTDDGSYGLKGFVTKHVEELIQAENRGRSRMYACGPEAMLRVVDSIGVKYGIPGQVSLEAPMPCGIGICLGCVVELRKGGYARVCVDGPVFNIGEVVI